MKVYSIIVNLQNQGVLCSTVKAVQRVVKADEYVNNPAEGIKIASPAQQPLLPDNEKIRYFAQSSGNKYFYGESGTATATKVAEKNRNFLF